MYKTILAIAFFLPLNICSYAQSYFPPLIGNIWETTLPASLGWCDDKITELNTYLENTQSKGFLVLKDGKIVIEKYFGTFTKDSLWYWASAGKTVTSFLVGKANEEGLININNKTSTYLGTSWSSLPLVKENLITVRHQLTMTTGLDDGVANRDCTLPACLQYKADAGTRWAYHNGPYTLLDKVIENATGVSFNAYYTAKLKNTIGMNGFFLQTGDNNVLYTNARSMARFGLVILNNGTWNGTNIMNNSAYFNQMVSTSQNLNLSYGYLWWLNGKASFMAPTLQTVFQGSLLPDAPADMFSALGKNGQLINVVPSSKLVVIRIGNNSDNSSVPFLYNNEIMKRVLALPCLPTATETAFAASIKVFPNPTKEWITVQGLQASAFRISVFNTAGQILHSTTTDTRIDIKDWKTGIYYVRIRQGKQILNKKIVIE